jgi:hypothetical protein
VTPAQVRAELLRRMFAARGPAGLWLASAAALALSWRTGPDGAPVLAPPTLAEVESDRYGWALARRDLNDPESATWDDAESRLTIAPTIVGLARQDGSGSLAVYKSQHYVEQTPSTRSQAILPGRYHYMGLTTARPRPACSRASSRGSTDCG